MRLGFAVLLAALLIAIAIPVYATGVGDTVQVRVAINVRSGPSTSYSVVGGASAGDVFTVHEVARGGQWYRVGVGRWICAWYTSSYADDLPAHAVPNK